MIKHAAIEIAVWTIWVAVTATVKTVDAVERLLNKETR